MIRILEKIIEQLRAEGYDVEGKIGMKWLNAQSSQQAGVLFVFAPMNYISGEFNSEECRISYGLGVPTQQDNTDVVLNIEAVEWVEKINRRFHWLLKNFSDDDTPVILSVGQMTSEQYHDISVYETCTSGIACQITVTIAHRATC